MGRSRVRVTWNADGVEDEVRAHVRGQGPAIGQMLADRISSRTPRSSGSGNMPGGGHAADSVGFEVSDLPDGVRIRVGYGKDAFYMMFAQVGTSRQAAEPTVLPTVLDSKAQIVAMLTRG